jgi:fibronectin type III domain protein
MSPARLRALSLSLVAVASPLLVPFSESSSAAGEATTAASGPAVPNLSGSRGEVWRGEEAIRRLDDGLARAAARNGMSAARLRQLLRDDPTVWIDADGVITYVDTLMPLDRGAHAGSKSKDEHPDGESTDAQSAGSAASLPLDQTFSLHSRPASDRTIYLDFDGAEVSGTYWNSGLGLPDGFRKGHSLDDHVPSGDGDLAAFNDAEREQIQQIWQRVAEDYAALDVDVTTDAPPPADIVRTSTSDLRYGTRVLISDDPAASQALCGDSCGGLALLSAFDAYVPSHSYYQPTWVFGHQLGKETKMIAEAASHEAGHTLGLAHDGAIAASGAIGYYRGHGAWAPIMGRSYDRPITQWSRGDYESATNTENDFAVMAAHGVSAVADEAPSDVSSSVPTVTPKSRYITSAADRDTYRLGTCLGPVILTAAGAPSSPNLDLRLELLDSAGDVVRANDPASTIVYDPYALSEYRYDLVSGMDAAIHATLPADTYYVRVDGVGHGTGTTGYTDYASIGAYKLTATGCGISPGAPLAPTGLTVVPAVDGNAATLTWSPPSNTGASGIANYRIILTGVYDPEDEINTEDPTGPPTPITLPAGATTYTWTGLKPGKKYRFAVQAINDAGGGTVAIENITTPGLPWPPSGLTVTPAADGGSATVNWDPPTHDGDSPITGYVVTQSFGFWPVGFSDVTTETSYTWDQFVVPGTRYDFSVATVNAFGASPPRWTTATMPTADAAPAPER